MRGCRLWSTSKLSSGWWLRRICWKNDDISKRCSACVAVPPPYILLMRITLMLNISAPMTMTMTIVLIANARYDEELKKKHRPIALVDKFPNESFVVNRHYMCHLKIKHFVSNCMKSDALCVSLCRCVNVYLYLCAGDYQCHMDVCLCVSCVMLWMCLCNVFGVGIINLSFCSIEIRNVGFCISWILLQHIQVKWKRVNAS